MTAYKKKLIEVALPLEAINKAAARAVIFAQMVDDPSAYPDMFKTEKAQEKERQRLFKIIEDLVQWENTTNEDVLQRARDEIWQSWRAICAENADHPRAKELFDRYKLPAFHDPFAGGGALPLEAQRLGLESYASDLNPVAVLICKAMIEIPPKFAGKPPVNPESRKKIGSQTGWKGAQGLAEDVRYYGKWMRDEAEKRIGHFYPKVEVTAVMAKDRPDLKPCIGKKLTVIAWLWARTVKSPNPAFAHVDVPLASTFMLSTKAGKEAYVEPVIENGGYSFTVKVGKPKDAKGAKSGTKLARGANFGCLMSGTPIAGDYIKAEGQGGRMNARLMAIVAESKHGRVFVPPTQEHEAVAREAHPDWRPEGALVDDARAFTPTLYGLVKWADLFTPRQIVTLTTFSDLVQAARHRVMSDATDSCMSGDGKSLEAGGTGANAYADALAVYLAMTSSKAARFITSLSTWRADESKLSRAFTRNDLPMTWDFAETNPFSGTGGDLAGLAEGTASVLNTVPAVPLGAAWSADAQKFQTNVSRTLISTDPPYYDNVPYADLSDYFYLWQRRALRGVLPRLFATLEVPKAKELVATAYRHGGKKPAEAFFLEGMTRAMQRLADVTHPGFPLTIYYAFKQSESDGDTGVTSTGWETFLDGVIKAGFAVTGTWPVRTEGKTRMRSMGSNALASSVVLVCRPRAADAPTATRRDFVNALKTELPVALLHLQRGNIAPVDLAQAAIGPGMAIFTRYEKVLDAEGKSLSVREALALINQTLDETLAQQEGDFDADSRWALAWFEQNGFSEGQYGVAETLSKAKNTSVDGMVDADIVQSKSGKVRLFKPDELPKDWDPTKDHRLTVWEMVHQLIRALDKGEATAAALVARLGTKAELARELAYRLYTLCERKKRAQEALNYNALVQSWPEIIRLAAEIGKTGPEQGGLFAET